MQKETLIQLTSTALLSSLLLVGCGNSNTADRQEGNGSRMGQNSGNNAEGEGSNIPYLRDNHANYSQHGTANVTPAPTKDAAKMSIDWTISGKTEENAEKLASHIAFMEARLKEDKNPRAFDKLFLMEAYMKYNGFYTTNIERSGTNVVVSKKANTACAYEVISAHSDVVSGDFFAQGEIMNDHSSDAEKILASSACNDVRTSVENYISQRQETRGGK
ncbi:MAG: hypothetical protein L3J43_03170 [Sulfurovum sp.]|nr:hypothetical protein [Sulfurovum sp.]